MYTGEDHVVFSNKPATWVKQHFVKKIKEMWREPIVEEDYDSTKDRLEIFFSKDELMSVIHEEKGYNTDLNGEGCFLFISTKKELLWSEVVILKEIRPNDNRDEFDAELILHDSWSYTLVLPGTIDKNHFSKYVYDTLISVLIQ